jgi:hypothetical protein
MTEFFIGIKDFRAMIQSASRHWQESFYLLNFGNTFFWRSIMSTTGDNAGELFIELQRRFGDAVVGVTLRHHSDPQVYRVLVARDLTPDELKQVPSRHPQDGRPVIINRNQPFSPH